MNTAVVAAAKKEIQKQFGATKIEVESCEKGPVQAYGVAGMADSIVWKVTAKIDDKHIVIASVNEQPEGPAECYAVVSR